MKIEGISVINYINCGDTFLSLFPNNVGVLLVGLFICMDEDMLYI